jgi:hypothetical protein
MDENRDILDLKTTSTTMKKGSKEEEDGVSSLEIINIKYLQRHICTKKRNQALFFELQGSNSYDLKPIGFESLNY